MLAQLLQEYRGKRALVLGIPRGGVPVADEVARSLEADLDVVVARKLGAPQHPELAVGAVSAQGGYYLNESLIRELDISEPYLRAMIRTQTKDARQREARFRGDRPALALKGRIVILVDDGLATGATMRAAIDSIHPGGPALLVVAVPVGSAETCAELGREVDTLICAFAPRGFGSVGAYYSDFEPTTDAEVIRILHDAAMRSGSRSSATAP